MSITLHTTLGSIKLELFCELTPKASKNFIGLCACSFYDGTIFHRNIKGFMIQGGARQKKDSKKIMKGGKTIYDHGKQKAFEDEIVDSLSFNSRGILALANKGPNTNASQFFITYDSCSHLNNTCTIFGKIIHGFQVLDAMEMVEVDVKNHRPFKDLKIISTTIHANPFAMKGK